MSRVKPSFWMIYFSKNTAGQLTAWILCVWMMFLMSVFSHIPQNHLSALTKWLSTAFGFLTVLALIVLALSLLVAWKDFRKLSYIFKGGVEITGKILSITFENKYVGRVQYEYQYQQHKYIQQEIFLYGSAKKLKKFHAGQETVVYVNPEDPYNSCIRDLYLNTF
ncbi:MAG: DUF3592 domain-containing protein [Chloroflexota bacterium]